MCRHRRHLLPIQLTESSQFVQGSNRWRCASCRKGPRPHASEVVHTCVDSAKSRMETRCRAPGSQRDTQWNKIGKAISQRPGREAVGKLRIQLVSSDVSSAMRELGRLIPRGDCSQKPGNSGSLIEAGKLSTDVPLRDRISWIYDDSIGGHQRRWMKVGARRGAVF